MSPLPITVYTPASALAHPVVMLREMARDFLASRELAWSLAVRDVRAQYRQALLGLLWAFILPLANSAAWLFLSRTGVITVGATALPYTAYVASGALLWAVFMESVHMPLQQTQAARSFLAKLNFPREALIMSGVLQVAFNAAIKLAILLAVCLMLRLPLGASALLVPVAMVSLVLVGTVLGLFFTPLGMLYNDVGRGLPLLLQFGMFVTPVAFPMPTQGAAAAVFQWNPISPLIVTARDWLSGVAPQQLGAFLLVNALAFCALFFVWAAYRLVMPILIERMSA